MSSSRRLGSSASGAAATLVAGVVARSAGQSTCDSPMVVRTAPVAVDSAFLALVDSGRLRLGSGHAAHLPLEIGANLIRSSLLLSIPHLLTRHI